MTLLSMGAIPAASNTDLTYPAISHVGGAFHAVLLAARGSARDTLRTVRELRRTEPQTPLIILYHGGVPFEAAEAARLGITDQLRSPATRKRLLRAIEHALGARRSTTVEEPESIGPAVTRVLIVEDDPASARTVEMSLEEIGCLVRSARSADEALAALEAAPADIAFIDRSLPGMDGIELTRRIRSLPGGAAEMRIIALSGSSSEETRNQFFSAGADDCLVKPASREQLQHAIYWTQTARR
jgi:CheY-like chemotaxis protein